EAPPAPAATTISTGLVGSQAAMALPASSIDTAAVPSFANFMTPPRKVPRDLGGRGCVKTLASGGLARGGRAFRALRQMIERREHAALLVRHRRQLQAHLDAGERAGEREIVEVAEVADAEHLAGEPSEPRAERHVVGVEDDLAQPVG